MFLKPPDSVKASSMFGYNGPEGLARCRELFRTRWRILLPLSLFFVGLGVAGLSFKSEKRPDIVALQQNFRQQAEPEFNAAGLELSQVYLIDLQNIPDSLDLMATWRYELQPGLPESSSELWEHWQRKFPDCVEKFKQGKACTTQTQIRLPGTSQN